MNKQTLLGLYTVGTLVALLGLFAVLTDLPTRLSGYRIGVHFPSAMGLHAGALVYESGVVVGSVDGVSVLPDYTTEILIRIHSTVDIPSNANFVIVQPLTGEPTLRIYPFPLDSKPTLPQPALPHRILPLDQQPQGKSPMTLDEFLANSQTQFKHVDAILQQLQMREPLLLDDLDHTLKHANQLMLNANSSLLQITGDAHRSLGGITAATATLTAQLSQSLAVASAELLDATARLDQSAKRGQPRIDHIFVQLDNASKSLAASVESVHQIAADPAIHENIVKSTRSLAATATTFAALLGDLRQVTGNSKTQADLRDAVTNIDAASQRAASFLGHFGKSSVGGVDNPMPSPSSSDAAATDGLNLMQSGSTLGGVPDASPSPSAPNGIASPAAGASPNIASPSPRPATKSSMRKGQQRLAQVSLRESELGPMRTGADGQSLSSPLLGKDRGPQTDIGVTIFPDGPSSLYLGANDIGANSTVSVAAIHHAGAAYFGEGLLYSRLGVMGGVKAGPIGVETKIYDPRRGSVDVYGNLSPTANSTIFAGERDVTRVTRRPVYGLELHF